LISPNMAKEPMEAHYDEVFEFVNCKIKFQFEGSTFYSRPPTKQHLSAPIGFSSLTVVGGFVIIFRQSSFWHVR
jgi:hypothetical protein